MVNERGGWFVVNVREARWYRNAAFGTTCVYEKKGKRFEQTGVRLVVLEPGKPNCHYHRENAQEDFLVLSGECLLLVNGEERRLGAWDYFHCPPGVTHVFVGAGDGPCVVLMIGHRPPEWEVFYPESDLARGHGAETPEPTADPEVSYARAPKWEEIEPPAWPID